MFSSISLNPLPRTSHDLDQRRPQKSPSKNQTSLTSARTKRSTVFTTKQKSYEGSKTTLSKLIGNRWSIVRPQISNSAQTRERAEGSRAQRSRSTSMDVAGKPREPTHVSGKPLNPKPLNPPLGKPGPRCVPSAHLIKADGIFQTTLPPHYTDSRSSDHQTCRGPCSHTEEPPPPELHPPA